MNENIYDGNNNNKINKKKYKKHAMSPLVSLDAGNVEKNIEMFNKMNTTTDISAGTSGGEAVGESLLENVEDIIDNIIKQLKPNLDWLEDK